MIKQNKNYYHLKIQLYLIIKLVSINYLQDQIQIDYILIIILIIILKK